MANALDAELYLANSYAGLGPAHTHTHTRTHARTRARKYVFL